MNNPLITVIVPVYNVEKYLNRCVESIVNQTYKNLEIILVDDGSPDNCPAMCDEWAMKDSRIKAVHQENKGLIRARDAGIENSNGEYLTFVDSDDWISGDCVEYLYELLINNEADVSAISLISTDIDAPVISNPIERTESYSFLDTVKNMNNDLCYICGKLYKKELMKKVPVLPDDIFFGEDSLRNYFVYKQCSRVCVSNQIKYFYFRHGEAGIAGKITYKLIDSSRKAYEIIDADFDKESEAYPYQLYNKILADFFLLNSIIRNNLCLDRYGELKGDILKCYGKIEDKSIIGKKHRYAISLLKLSRFLYNRSILLRTRLRGY
ncbi:MAG: glycosyltransferase [Eubacterium sp.]|nr:glycosyltransferase [Eubacterium sp.]